MKKTIVIVLAAVVLLVGSSAMAGVHLTVTQSATSDPGLTSYTITAVSTAGERINTWEGLQIFTDATKTTLATNLHNVWNGFGTPSVAADNWIADPITDPAWAEFDTYVLLSGIAEFGSPLTETNDGSNPTGMSLSKGGWAATLGLGSYGHPNTTDAFTVLGSSWTSIDFLQIVMETGQSCHLAVNVLDTTGTRYAQSAGVPEPATMTALALGGLALLRRRRK